MTAAFIPATAVLSRIHELEAKKSQLMHESEILRQRIAVTEEVLREFREVTSIIGQPEAKPPVEIGPKEAVLQALERNPDDYTSRNIVIEGALAIMGMLADDATPARRKVLDQTIRNLEAKGRIQRNDEGLRLSPAGQNR